MFVIFGWEKSIKPMESVLKTQCYHCSNNSNWSIWKETEWVSLFFINVLPFNNKYHISCDICGDGTELSTSLAKKALMLSQRSHELHDELINIIESYQFEGFTEGQINYHKSVKSNGQ